MSQKSLKQDVRGPQISIPATGSGNTGFTLVKAPKLLDHADSEMTEEIKASQDQELRFIKPISENVKHTDGRTKPESVRS
jgi:hypothetical protein